MVVGDTRLLTNYICMYRFIPYQKGIFQCQFFPYFAIIDEIKYVVKL